jgi:hypothetical protein
MRCPAARIAQSLLLLAAPAVIGCSRHRAAGSHSSAAPSASSTSTVARASEPSAPLPATSPPTPAVRDDIVLYPVRDGSKFEAKNLHPHTERAVLDAVFGAGHYLHDYSQCKQREFDELEDLRAAGQIVPHVVQVARGAFTIAGRSQTLYAIDDGECIPIAITHHGSLTIAVFDGTSLLVHFVAGSSLARVLDLVDVDGDGVQEVEVQEFFGPWQGVVLEWLRIERFQSGHYETLQDFGKVYESNCMGIGERTTQQSTIHLLVRVDGSYAFRTDNKSTPCEPLVNSP